MSEIILKEVINENILEYILNNKEIYTKLIYNNNLSCINLSNYLYENIKHNNIYDVPTKFLKYSVNGVKKTIFKYNNDKQIGRMYPDDSISILYIKKEIRDTICYNLYYNIDIIDAHINILYNLCKKHNLISIYIEKFIIEKKKIYDELIKKFNLSKKEIKILIIKILYRGIIPKKYKTYIIKNLIYEIRKNTEIIFKLENKYVIKNNNIKQNRLYKNKSISSGLSYILCTYENRILLEIVKYFKLKNILTDKGVLMHDGLLIYKNKNYNMINYIKDCEFFIKKNINFDIKLSIKNMDKYLFEYNFYNSIQIKLYLYIIKCLKKRYIKHNNIKLI